MREDQELEGIEMMALVVEMQGRHYGKKLVQETVVEWSVVSHQ